MKEEKEDKYLRFKKIDENTTELFIYGDIRKKDWIDNWLGDESGRTGALDLATALEQIDTPTLVVRINSYGGSVSEGLAIYSLLSDFRGELITKVDGFACSAASVIFMAGKKRIVPESGLLMIHNAWSSATGDYNALAKAAEDLKKITQPSVDIYVSKTNLSEEEIRSMMDREEWINSKEAFDYGFSTVLEKNDAKQSIESDYLYKLVNNHKSLQKELKEKTELIEELQTKINNSVNLAEDPWRSFFN
jgi:ATP-dependent Clp protease protease subunit|nr:MAG TPA: Putative ATP dependent Clp protease [Caudoviricetes sp.]